MALSLPDARGLSDEVLEALRVRAVHGCELGYTEAEIAALLGVAPETISRWWVAYAEGGPEALPGDRTGRPVGLGRTLSDEQASHIQDLIDGHSPEDLNIAAALWTRKAVRDLIRKEFAIDVPVRTVGEYLKRWGYTAKAPRRHVRGQRIPTRSPSGSRRPTRRSSGERPARVPRSTGATRPVPWRIDSRGRAMLARESRHGSRCRTRTSG